MYVQTWSPEEQTANERKYGRKILVSYQDLKPLYPEVDDPRRVNDAYTYAPLAKTFTNEEVQTFLCAESLGNMLFFSDPNVIVHGDVHPEPEPFWTRLQCETFEMNNTQTDETFVVAHYFFNKEAMQLYREFPFRYDKTNRLPRRQNKGVRQRRRGPDVEQVKARDLTLKVMKSNENRQAFNYTVSEDLAFVTLQKHQLFRYTGGRNWVMKEQADFEDFEVDPGAQQVFELLDNEFGVTLQDPVNLKVRPENYIEVGRMVTTRILGIAVEYGEINRTELAIDVIDDVVDSAEPAAEALHIVEGQSRFHFQVPLNFRF